MIKHATQHERSKDNKKPVRMFGLSVAKGEMTEGRPRCQRCLRQNLACHYGGIRLIWENDSEARGVCHGRQGVWKKAGKASTRTASSPEAGYPSTDAFPVIERAYFLNTTYKDFELHYTINTPKASPCTPREHQEDDHDEQNSQFNEVVVATDPSLHAKTLLHALSPFPVVTRSSDSILLSYYDLVICASRTVLDDEQHNPYRHVLLPMALHSQGLYEATLAISAYTLHLSQPDLATTALEHRQQALKALIHLINQENPDGTVMDEILALVLMICWYDISDGCRPSWVKHLAGFRGLLHHIPRRNKTNQSLLSLRLEKFFLQYFVFHLVLAKATFHDGDMEIEEQPPSEGRSSLVHEGSGSLAVAESWLSPSTSALSIQMSLDDLDQIDLYMGFSNSLLLLINEIAEMTKIKPDASDREQRNLKLLARACRIKESLVRLEKTNSHLGSMPELADKEPTVVAIAEIYRLGALLYLHEVLSTPALEFPYCRRIFKAGEKEHYVSQILDMTSSNITQICSVASMPLWSLFLAGCCAISETDRVKVLQIFEHVEKQCQFGNVIPAHAALEAVWRQKDLLRDEPSPASGRAQNQRGNRAQTYVQYEWEKALDMLGGWRISLT
ncbi:hypothetical protein ABEF95_016570 [Exophiala dermatitidis]|uniref:Zn(2)-C6 fungal-type domain-containing protein n=1 Tax=Exophiala dermatitidis (strain ATCC 34100 / CBS 525.76 / NIH/UT8656) TaxID=858893 RepID=H6C729_EXODN|nr:uncharacterized protein HMPREF1120_07513 [Exophiala dermatitidis NIH/UT8656]EHY59525.1 hypothetical protein HMPREF1120_07513 [Exophiala dermatitidis NIH/UT8656]KAJ4522707.1 hypothetical protein HRR75_001101 [Exophiala dermatitidis]KAJ4559674.1 hypothetical protein HRR78_000194 [Exophiala dermatitidis]